jgi:hypothetical protein
MWDVYAAKRGDAPLQYFAAIVPPSSVASVSDIVGSQSGSSAWIAMPAKREPVRAGGVTVGGIVVSLLPVIAAFALVALVATGFVVAFRHDGFTAPL